MDDVAQRIGMFVMDHLHGRDLGFWIAIATAVAVSIWLPILTDRRKRAATDADDLDFRPRRREPLPRSFDETPAAPDEG